MTMMQVTPDVLHGIPLFVDLDEIELVQVMACFSLQRLIAGEILFTEGAPATNACFVIEGELQALTALPGGGEVLVGAIGPGDMIGEMALITGGSRTATVRAQNDVVVLSVSFAFFQAALNQLSVPAFKILRRIMHSLASRLEVLQNRVLSAWDCGSYHAGLTAPNSSGANGEYDNNPKASFDYRPFLAVTPFFEEFEEPEIERIVEVAQVIEVPRNEFLFRESDAACCCFIVARGAVDSTIFRDRRYQLAVHGPGRIIGGNSLIKRKPHCYDARTRSDSLLLRFDARSFTNLFNGNEIAALRFQTQFSRNQLLDLKSADNLLTTLVSQAHVRENSPATEIPECSDVSSPINSKT